MAIEIERKFLVNSDDYKQLALPVYYKQGYLCNSPNTIVRIRIANNKGYITIKGKTCGISRTEFEYEIPTSEAHQLLSEMSLNKVVEKNRYKIKYAGNIWEIDEFLGENEGLIIAEIELKSENATFDKPSWIGKEVSTDSRYFNSNLSKNPFKNW
ncbi:MAG: CYTH domain-containing protein [Paludibacteraceae bacterium]|nr:CYTH domain-containing protein [Paludibacteraceae bacterium]MBN2787814.1 CYTH domain-containing protein [Paludibacteraceae bacterium]